MKITKEKFKSYYRVQMTGRYNMIMQATLAMLAAGLTREEYFECIKITRRTTMSLSRSQS